MRVLQRLTTQSLLANKRRTLVTILGVMLSSALIFAVVGMVTSLQKMMINFTVEDMGNYHEMYEAVPVESLKLIENNANVESYYYSEILSSKNTDEDTLEYYAKYQNLPYSSDMYERLDVLPSNATGKYNIYVRYRHPHSYPEYGDDIQTALESETGELIHIRTNKELLQYEGVVGGSTLTALYSMAAIVIAIIIVTSIFVIRNSFSISAAERERQFGMLASVGATSRQIRHSVFFEGTVIAALGIPLGIILGIIAVAILVALVNYLLADSLAASVIFSLPLWIFPAVILLSLVTIFCSCLMPAIRAGRILPIEAIRGNHDIKIKPKKLRTSRFISNTFGVGGTIADKNLKRSRKKYRTTVISIVLSVATFIGLFSFLSYGKDMLGIQYDNTDIDLAINNMPIEFYRELDTQFNLHDSVYYEGTKFTGAGVYYMEQSRFEEFAKSVGVNAKDYSHVALMNDLTIEHSDDGSRAMKRATDLHDGDTYQIDRLNDIPEKYLKACTVSGSAEEHIAEYVDYPCIDEMGFKTTSEFDIEITKIIDTWPVGFDNTFWIMIILPENYYLRDKLGDDPGINTYFAEKVENLDEVMSYVEDYFEQHVDAKSHAHYLNVRENSAQVRRMYLLICIFLYGFIIVVMLIGMTNIFNTITTNIALRAKEFAMLKSIGMTSQEFNRMVRLESLLYTGRALLIGIPIGLLISYAFYLSFANSLDFGYRLPWLAILISIVAAGLLIWSIMRYSVKQVEKQNIIETIRSENI